MTAKSPAKGTTRKHAAPSSAAKHAAHVKHEAHLAHMAHLRAIGKAPKVTVKATPAKPAKAAKARSFAIGDLLPVCAFEAIAQSLRLAGARVHPDDVGQLWTLADAPTEGASVGEALAAAALFGLAGCRPVAGYQVAEHPYAHQALGELRGDFPDPSFALGVLPDVPLDPVVGLGQGALGVHGLILGIDVPGSHAVLATADGWWSWGELHDPWPCQIEEAWAVSWS